MSTYEHELLKDSFSIDKRVLSFIEETEAEIKPFLEQTLRVARTNQLKVLAAMQRNRLSDAHFGFSSGYGYNDLGREALEKIYADVFRTEAALVRPQLVSGTHALTVALFGNLKYGDEILSPNGFPYDTLQGVIGIRETKNSLMEYGIRYRQVELAQQDEFDWDGIARSIHEKTKLISIQRSKGYSWRRSFSVEDIGRLIRFVKGIKPDVICMVDNCYGEFVDEREPSEVGADLVVGSLIKNPGGGLAPVGGYIAGKEEFVENAAHRLTAPGLGREVGPTLGLAGTLLQGLFLAPTVVSAGLQGAILSARVFEKLDFQVLPRFDEKRSDIVQAIQMQSKERLLAFCEGIQMAAPVDSFVKPVPWDMPGYDHQVVMAAGAFVQGSSIELSADAPIKEPYIAYFQGGLTEHHAKFGVLLAVDHMLKQGLLQF